VPTADEFDAFAAAFDATAERLTATVRAVERSGLDHPVDAPTVTARLIERIDDLTGRCRSAAAHCADLASECRHRAEVCRRYTAAYVSYEYAGAAWERRAREAEPGEWIGSRPQIPSRPAPWVERG
jgi:hypothetical protein